MASALEGMGVIRHLKGKVRRPEAPAGYECESEDARKAWEGVH